MLQITEISMAKSQTEPLNELKTPLLAIILTWNDTIERGIDDCAVILLNQEVIIEKIQSVVELKLRSSNESRIFQEQVLVRNLLESNM
nr:MutL-like protein 1 [Ipomoea batatas]